MTTEQGTDYTTAYDEYYEIEVGGSRIAIMTCFTCGAAVILDKSEVGPRVHDRWHASLETSQPCGASESSGG